jgi:hypothetical protein
MAGMNLLFLFRFVRGKREPNVGPCVDVRVKTKSRKAATKNIASTVEQTMSAGDVYQARSSVKK